MDIVRATRDFEKWLSRSVPLLKSHLKIKHAAMASDPFIFLRATFYRWAQKFPQLCPEANRAKEVLAVGDLHVENFGTWRDAEGRLVWGVNDFDEAAELPYTNDLVRLAVTVLMASKSGHVSLSAAGACEELLAGYVDGLNHGGRPFVLAEDHPKLRELAQSRLKKPHKFWQKILAQAKVKARLDAGAKAAVEKTLPAGASSYTVYRRIAGKGSLGKPRLIALMPWAGGRISREAKALTPSACDWAAGRAPARPSLYAEIIAAAVRCPDPFLTVADPWIIRRLAPDCTRIELAELRSSGAPLQLIRAMGFEAANIHLGTSGARAAILRDLSRRPSGWLLEASRTMSRATHKDFEAWRRR